MHDPSGSHSLSASEELVRGFCAAWARRDVDVLLSYFTDDAVYHNIPMAPVQGPEAVRAVMEFFVPGSEEIEFQVRAMASAPADQGAIVFTERVDRFVMGAKTVELPVAGVFEVRAGKIAAWRDYFDMATWSNQTA